LNNPQISDFTKILPVGAKLFNEDEQRHTDMTTVIVASCNLPTQLTITVSLFI
jgi:hypothetical protein